MSQTRPISRQGGEALKTGRKGEDRVRSEPQPYEGVIILMATVILKATIFRTFTLNEALC